MPGRSKLGFKMSKKKGKFTRAHSHHKQERDKHMEGKAKRKHMTKSGEKQTVLDNYIWSDKETWVII